MSEKSKWVWMPHPGHFICSNWCRFKLNTYVGGYIVSTVGEYVPDAGVREIIAQQKGVVLEGKGDERLYEYMSKVGYEPLGLSRLYETMVFKAKRAKDGCCPWEASSYENLDSGAYMTADEAYTGHLKLCKKWSKKKI